MISITIPKRTLTLEVDEKELERRKAAWQKPAPKVTSGYLAFYSQLASSAAQAGC